MVVEQSTRFVLLRFRRCSAGTPTVLVLVVIGEVARWVTAAPTADRQIAGAVAWRAMWYSEHGTDATLSASQPISSDEEQAEEATELWDEAASTEKMELAPDETDEGE